MSESARLRAALLVLILGCVLPVFGCGADGSHPSARAGATSIGSGPIKIVCTTGMVADLVRHVGGARVEIDQLMGEGVDPHLYRPSITDIARLDAADLVFYSGLHLEGKMADIFARMASDGRTAALTDGLPHDRLLDAGQGQHDPHVWFDVKMWSDTLPAIMHLLSKFDPSHATEFQAAAQKYRDELLKLDAECRERLATIPASRRVLVTAHDAFHYFGRAYDLEVKAIQGVSTESEAGVREINQLVSFLVERGIKAVFVESSVNSRNIEALVEGAAARGHELRVGGELFSDAMGRAGTPEGTYIGMVRHNVNTIAEALR